MSEENMNSTTGNKPMPWMALAVLLAVLVIGGVLFRDKLFPAGMNSKMTKEQAGETSRYQAVFLANGQIYFGKLSDTNSMYATLKDIYYLQVTQPAIQGPQDNNTPQQKPQAQISLVKLGSELHGPEDVMKINRDHILFYEDLKEDGKVVQTIREYQKNPPKSENK